jgi:hypothetical protein
VSAASPTTPPASPIADPAADPAPSDTCHRLLREDESSHSDFVNGLLGMVFIVIPNIFYIYFHNIF